MAIAKKMFDFLFTIYIYFYILLYLGYILFICFGLSSYSLVSIPAVLLPFVLLLFMIRVSWKHLDIKMRSEKKNLKSLVVIGTVPVFVCMVLLGINEYKTNFTTEKWVSNVSERVYIVDDLLSEYELNGLTKSEIVARLGPPSETEYFKSENNIVYYLGNERGIISIDSEWLVIEFDASETVTDYDVRTD